MPELDAVSILAFASFVALVIAWLVVPTAAVTATEDEALPTAA
jgi:hypothetical protein